MGTLDAADFFLLLILLLLLTFFAPDKDGDAADEEADAEGVSLEEEEWAALEESKGAGLGRRK